MDKQTRTKEFKFKVFKSMFGNFGITRYTMYNFVTKLLTTALVRVIHSYHEDINKRFINSLILHRVFSF